MFSTLTAVTPRTRYYQGSRLRISRYWFSPPPWLPMSPSVFSVIKCVSPKSNNASVFIDSHAKSFWEVSRCERARRNILTMPPLPTRAAPVEIGQDLPEPVSRHPAHIVTVTVTHSFRSANIDGVLCASALVEISQAPPNLQGPDHGKMWFPLRRVGHATRETEGSGCK